MGDSEVSSHHVLVHSSFSVGFIEYSTRVRFPQTPSPIAPLLNEEAKKRTISCCVRNELPNRSHWNLLKITHLAPDRESQPNLRALTEGECLNPLGKISDHKFDAEGSVNVCHSICCNRLS